MNKKNMHKIKIDLEIIGVIHSPFKNTKEAPPQGKNEISKIEIFADYEAGLKDVEGFSHLSVFYWLHKSKGYNLDVITPWDTKSHGLFTTCSPHRPNPLGYSVVKLIKKEKNILQVKGLDAIEGTPVIDIKPYFKRIKGDEIIKQGWIEQTNLKRN